MEKKHVQVLHNDIAEILLKLALNINQSINQSVRPSNTRFASQCNFSVKRHQPRRRMSIRTTHSMKDDWLDDGHQTLDTI